MPVSMAACSALPWRFFAPSAGSHIQIVDYHLIYAIGPHDARHIVRSDLEWLKASRHTHVAEPASAHIEDRPRARHGRDTGQRACANRVLPVCPAHPKPTAEIDDELREGGEFLRPRGFAHFLDIAITLCASCRHPQLRPLNNPMLPIIGCDGRGRP